MQRRIVVLHQGVDRIGRDLRLLGQQGRPRQLRAPGGEPGIHGFGGHRPGDGITLKTTARHGGQRQRVLRRAHALGHHGQAHQRGSAQQPVSDTQPGAAGEQVAGEAAVDLDRRDLELLQMGEAGAAGAKVVERDPHAQVATAADDKAGHAAVELGAMLGDFEHEPFRRTLRMAFQRGTQVGEKLRIEKMARTDVDVDLNLPALQMPALRLIERGRQYETPDRHTDLLVIQHRLEGARRVHAVGVAQAQQRFGAVDANHARSRAAIERQNGLVVQFQPVVMQRVEHPVELAIMLLQGVFHMLVEKAVLLTAAFLGGVHRQIGAAHQGERIHRLRLLLNDDAQRQPDLQGVALHRELLLHAFDQSVGHCAQLVERGVPGEHHHELVSAQPRQHIGLAQHATQTLAHGHQQLISHRMAQTVVDDLEAVEIDHAHGQSLMRMLDQRGAQFLHERPAVGQAGEIIAMGDGAIGLVLVADLLVVLHQLAAEALFE